MQDLLITLLILSLLTLTSITKNTVTGSEQVSAHQHLTMDTDSTFTSLLFDDHEHQNVHDHGHNPFDHSHETQHLPPRLVLTTLETSQIWLTAIHMRPLIVAKKRLDRPPTRLLIS